MSFKFEKLIVWQRAMDWGEEIFLLTKQFQSEEKFNLTSQLNRAVDSIALNISEGSILQSKAEMKRFFGYSIRSISECITCLYKADRRNYISKKQFDEHYLKGFELMNMLIAFQKKLI